MLACCRCGAGCGGILVGLGRRAAGGGGLFSRFFILLLGVVSFLLLGASRLLRRGIRTVSVSGLLAFCLTS